MTTGVLERFIGKIEIGSLVLGSGGLIDSVSGIAGKTDFLQRLSLPVTAVANTDYPAFAG